MLLHLPSEYGREGSVNEKVEVKERESHQSLCPVCFDFRTTVGGFAPI